MIDKQLIKQEAENVAYTCKGLFKTADYYRILYYISTGLSFSIGLVLLAVDISSNVAKVLGAFGVLNGIILLMNQNNINNTEGYVELGPAAK